MHSEILSVEPNADYELIDSGEGEKLERFGKIILSRPDPQALWPKKLDPAEWKKAHGHFTREDKKGEWTLKQSVPDRWPVAFGGLKFHVKPTAFKHVGLFPEQAANWSWLRASVENRRSKMEGDVNVLNLFGYTGGASMACAAAGAKVVHVDGSKSAMTWAKENARLSGFEDRPIRYILDDARTFVSRELKRGRKYHGIIMDPPSFGHGPKNELWKIEDHFLPLIKDCFELLHAQPTFFLINGYSAGYSALAYYNNLSQLVQKFGGTIEMGELTIPEKTAKTGKEKSALKEEETRLLPCGIFARWSSLK